MTLQILESWMEDSFDLATQRWLLLGEVWVTFMWAKEDDSYFDFVEVV